MTIQTHIAGLDPAAGRGLAAVSHARVEIAVHGDIAGLAEEWRAFERRAAGTFFQTHAWCAAWQATVGQEQCAEPRIVVGRNEAGRLLFLLPLAIRRRQGCRVVEWMGSDQINYGYGLYDRGFLPLAAEWFEGPGWQILNALGQVDAVRLKAMPERLHGLAHPLSGWFTLKGRNQSYVMALDGGFEALYARKRSAETRRGNRKRDAKLASFGGIDFGLPATRVETHEVLDDMFDQQQARLEDMGVRGVFGDAERRFVHRLADQQGDAGPTLLPYRLKLGGEVTAVMLGGLFANTYWALIPSLAEGEHRRCSPGDAALRRMIEACCDAGLRAIDFGSGDTSYKDHWADRTVPLHDTVRAVTPRGYAWALAAFVYVVARRAIKRTPALWALASGLRRKLLAKR